MAQLHFDKFELSIVVAMSRITGTICMPPLPLPR
jgi:hypothetical protein